MEKERHIKVDMRGRDRLGLYTSVYLLHSSFPSSHTHPPSFPSFSIKVADKDGLATFSGL